MQFNLLLRILYKGDFLNCDLFFLLDSTFLSIVVGLF